jgi:phosphoribosylaminoimidazole-succinocarboxamide synthase
MKASLNFLHHQANDWLREMEFYKEEFAILTKRLEEVAAKNTAQDIMAQVEHFQNKFIMLREQLDILKHDLGVRHTEILELSKERPEHIDQKFVAVHDTLQERVKDFSRSIADTRYEFNRFLGQVL